MANKKVLHKRSNIGGKAPTSDQLDYGELAINYNAGNEQLYIKNSNNDVVGLIGQSGGGDITSVTASGTSPLTLTSTTNNGAVTISGSVDLSNYATTSSVPTKTSDLTNDSGFITSSDIPAAPTLSDLGGVGSVSASGTSPLTLSASKSGTTVAISGSVDLSSKQDTLTAGDNITISSSNVISADVPVTKWYDLWVSAHDIQYTEGDGYTPSAIEMCVYSYNDTTTSLTIENSVNYQMEIWYTNGSVASYYGQTSSTKVSVSLPTSSSRILYITIIATLQSGMVLTKQIYCHENSIGYSNWNYYLFEGGSSAQTVVIDGESISIPANTIVEGNFTTDITQLSYQLKRIIIRGDISASISTSGVVSNTILEEVDLTFSPSYSRSFDYMFRNLRGLKRLRVSGGQATGAQYMCYYVGSSTNEGCEIDIKGMDFSQMTSTYGARYMCEYAKIASIDLSGHTFSGSAIYMFAYATVGNANVSGCTFSGTAYEMFRNVTVDSVDLSGCTFSEDAYYMFWSATVNSANVSGCTFSGDTGCMFYQAKEVGSADVSGCTFKDAAWSMFCETTVGYANVSGCTFEADAESMFNSATVGSADVSGCTFNGKVYSMFQNGTINKADLSGCAYTSVTWISMFNNSTINDLNISGSDLSSITDATTVWTNATIGALNLNGVTLPTDQTSNWYFVNYLDSATSIGAITGDYGEIGTYRDISLVDLSLRRGSVIAIFDALALNGGGNAVFLSSYSGARITPEDTIIATNKGWYVYYS